MGWWSGKWRDRGDAQKIRSEDDWGAYLEVCNAQSEWKRAWVMFNEALGQDEIDYAIYILEAAERKYQIHLKHAKLIGLNRSTLQNEI